MSANNRRRFIKRRMAAGRCAPLTRPHADGKDCFKYLMRGAKPSFSWEDYFRGVAAGCSENASGMCENSYFLLNFLRDV